MVCCSQHSWQYRIYQYRKRSCKRQPKAFERSVSNAPLTSPPPPPLYLNTDANFLSWLEGKYKLTITWMIHCRHCFRKNDNTGSRKNSNTQHRLLTVFDEKWNNQLEKRKFTGLMFIDLSKAFDSVNHNLEAYCFSWITLQLMRSHLKNFKHRALASSCNNSQNIWDKL